MPNSKTSRPETLSREIKQEEGSFGDPHLTPKPLKVAKRTLHSSEPVVINPLSCFSWQSQFQPQRGFAPTRRSSGSRNFTQPIPSQQDPESRNFGCVTVLSSTDLYVHKQRRDGSGYTSSSAPSAEHEEVNPSTSDPTYTLPHKQGAPTKTESGLRGVQKENKVIAAARSQAARAFSTGDSEKNDWPSPTDDKPLILPARTPMVTFKGRRRAVTTSEAPFSRLEYRRNDPIDLLRRQSSFKKRLVTRMISGLTPRARDSHTASKEKPQSTQVPPQCVPALTSPTCQDIDAVRGSFSSGTSIFAGSDLDGALSAFPTPPTSNHTSPTSVASTRSLHQPTQRYRNLGKPEKAAVMGAELTLTSEYDGLDYRDGSTMLVAIDVQGALNTTSNGQNLWSQHTGLDVVVIIDNSRYTSPTTLMASCETARFLASILNVVTDRIAIICNSSLQVPESESTLIWPLGRVKPQRIKTALDAITTTMQKPTANIWTQAIVRARQILTHSPVPDEDTETLQDTFGHVFVMTGNTVGLSSELLTDDKLQFHVICPASVPREDHRSVECNGWKLQLLSDAEPRAVSANKDTDPASLLNKLRRLITHARSGAFKGVMSDVVIDVKPGQDCSIEGVMGSSKHPILHPGESFTVLVKVRINGTRAKEHSLSQATKESGVLIQANDIMNELERMLGSSAVKLLTARLKYKHSVLPDGTICSISADCCLKQQIRSPDRRKGQEKPPTIHTKECTLFVQKRLAYHIATHGSAKYALSNLRKEFGEIGARSYCPDYIKLIMKELDFQARIVDRLENGASPMKPLIHSNSVILGNLAGHSSHGPFHAEDNKPQDWITDAVDEGVSTSEDVQLRVLSDLSRDSRSWRKTSAEAEEARLIWGDVRKPSNSPRLRQHFEQGRRRAVNIRGGENRKVRVKDIVLGKKVIGSDTLWSINSTGEPITKAFGSASR